MIADGVILSRADCEAYGPLLRYWVRMIDRQTALPLSPSLLQFVAEVESVAEQARPIPPTVDESIDDPRSDPLTAATVEVDANEAAHRLGDVSRQDVWRRTQRKRDPLPARKDDRGRLWFTTEDLEVECQRNRQSEPRKTA